MRNFRKYISKILLITLFTGLLLNVNNIASVFALDERVTIVNDNTTGDGINQFKYSGPWGTSTGYNQFYNGDEHWSNSKNWGTTAHENINYTVKFYGEKIELYGNKQPGLGIYDVYIDGEKIDEIDAYNSSSIYQQLLYTSPALEEGEHVIKVTATGRKNAASSSTDMQIDFAKIYHSPIQADSITLSRESLNLREGLSFTLEAQVNPSNAENQEIVWESLGENIAKVSNGVITAVSSGTTTINGLESNIVLNYNFEVLDVVQPSYEETEFHLDLWQYPYTTARYYGVEPFSEEHFEILKPQMELYRNTGGKVITTTIVEDPWNQQTYDKYPSMVKWTKNVDGTFDFDYNHFDQWVEFNFDLGIDEQINCYSIVPWNNRIQYFDESTNSMKQETPSPGSTRWNELWTIFLTDFIEHLDAKGWFDLTYIAMDERGINDMTAALNLIESLPNKDGETLKISGAMNYNSLDNGILDRIADISINLGHIDHNND